MARKWLSEFTMHKLQIFGLKSGFLPKVWGKSSNN